MIRGIVADIFDQYHVILDVGRNQGVKLGMNFLIFEEMTVRHPSTNEIIDKFPFEKGLVKVTKVNENSCLAISNTSKNTLTSFGNLLKTWATLSSEEATSKWFDSLIYQTSPAPLNVDITQIRQQVKSKSIQKGDSVLYLEEKMLLKPKADEILLLEPSNSLDIKKQDNSLLYKKDDICLIEIDLDSEMVYLSIFGEFKYKNNLVVNDFTIPIPMIAWDYLCGQISELDNQALENEIFTKPYKSKWEEQTEKEIDPNIIPFVRLVGKHYLENVFNKSL